MSFTNTTSKVKYLGNGAANVYSVTFPFQKKEDLLIKVRDESTLMESTLVLNTDYLVFGNFISGTATIQLTSAGQSWISGGNLRSNFTILIKRNPAINQISDFRNAGPYFAELHEDRFDRQTYIDQLIKEIMDRSLSFNEFSDVTNGIIPEPEDGQYLAWDGTTGRLKNASTTIDPLLLQAIDMSYNNTLSGLIATNTQIAIDEVSFKIDDLGVNFDDLVLEVDSIESRTTVNETDIGSLDGEVSSLTALVDSLFPVGKLDQTLTNDAPNSLNWLRMSGLGAQTFSKTGPYAGLYNYLLSKGFFADPFSHDLFSESGANFTIEDFAALSPRAIGNTIINSHQKIGPTEGSIQEDQMQKITGTYTISQSFSGDNSATGAMTNTAGATSTFTGVTNNTRTRSIIDFDSFNSPGTRVDNNGSIADGETRINAFGVYYWIRY